MKTVNIEKVKELIANDRYGKWKRSDYEYALSGMYTYYTEWSLTKLPALKELFYERAKTHFHMIKGYVCFRDHDCFIEADDVDYSNLPQNKSFVVTHDYLDPNSEFTNATTAQLRQIKKHGFTCHFKMYDDDGIHYYSGYLLGKYEGCEQAFNPLEDYGMPNAGCTDIKYKESDGKYHSL